MTMVTYGMVIDVDKCMGCDICLKVCKDEYTGNDYPPYSAAQPEAVYGYGPEKSYGWPHTPSTSKPWVTHGQLWMDVREENRGRYPRIQVRYYPRPCMQCAEPPCLEAALNDAVIKRPDGIVIIDPEKSRGQVQLVESCPYGRIFLNSENMILQKCTFCAHLVDKGGSPRCVEACPVKAIVFGNLDDPESQVSKKVLSLSAVPMHGEYGTGPRVFYSGPIKI